MPSIYSDTVKGRWGEESWAMSNSSVDVGYRVGSAAEDQIADLKRVSVDWSRSWEELQNSLLFVILGSDCNRWREPSYSIPNLVRHLEVKKERNFWFVWIPNASVVFGGLEPPLSGDALKSGDADAMVGRGHRLFCVGGTEWFCP